MLRDSASQGRAHAMLQSYNEASYTDHLSSSYPSHYHQQQWYNNYIHEGENSGTDWLGGGCGAVRSVAEEKEEEWRLFRQQHHLAEAEHSTSPATPGPTAAYIPPQPSQDGGYPTGPEVGLLSGADGSTTGLVGMDSPLMGQVLQESGLVLSPGQHEPGRISAQLIPNGIPSIEQSHTPKDEEDSLGKTEFQCSRSPGAAGGAGGGGKGRASSLKLPGFHQTFGNITEIGRFSQPDEFFESRPPEIPDPPPKVSESLEVKRKPRGRKRKQPEPRELYPRTESGGGGGTGGGCGGGMPCSGGGPEQWTPPSQHHQPQQQSPAAAPHWEPAPHWHRPHPYQYGGPPAAHHPPYHPAAGYPGGGHHGQYPQYHHGYHHHLDCPPPPPYHPGYYQPSHWHPAAREYLHHHPYQGYV